ncbi:MAG: 50S ribosomal protein L32 [Candidatus Babeliales bacterium]
MPCPKRKTSKARRNQRSANKGLEVQTFTHCPNSGVPVMPHIVCLESGFYKGVKVIATKADRLVLRNQRRQTQEARKSKASEQAPSEKE